MNAINANESLCTQDEAEETATKRARIWSTHEPVVEINPPEIDDAVRQLLASKSHDTKSSRNESTAQNEQITSLLKKV
jgi:hypothetical protein